MEAYRQTLNRANGADYAHNKTKKLNELMVDYMYPLKAIESVNTKYGLKKVVILEEDLNGQLIEVFLPTRFTATIFDMNYIHYLVYHGKKPMKNGEEFNDIEFMVYPPEIAYEQHQQSNLYTPLKRNYTPLNTSH